MKDKYIPISCAYYDEFESAAVKKIDCEIIYSENMQEKKIKAKVIDFKTKNKEEFMILDNGISIRLDKILLFNGISPKDKNHC